MGKAAEPRRNVGPNLSNVSGCTGDPRPEGEQVPAGRTWNLIRCGGEGGEGVPGKLWAIGLGGAVGVAGPFTNRFLLSTDAHHLPCSRTAGGVGDTWDLRSLWGQMPMAYDLGEREQVRSFSVPKFPPLQKGTYSCPLSPREGEMI